jgi:hypothetical protein
MSEDVYSLLSNDPRISKKLNLRKIDQIKIK